VSRPQAVGDGLELIAAARGQTKVTALLGKGFGGRSPYTFRSTGDQDALAAQM
jgi:hypothetical protein